MGTGVPMRDDRRVKVQISQPVLTRSGRPLLMPGLGSPYVENVELPVVAALPFRERVIFEVFVVGAVEVD